MIKYFTCTLPPSPLLLLLLLLCVSVYSDFWNETMLHQHTIFLLNENISNIRIITSNCNIKRNQNIFFSLSCSFTRSLSLSIYLFFFLLLMRYDVDFMEFNIFLSDTHFISCGLIKLPQRPQVISY